MTIRAPADAAWPPAAGHDDLRRGHEHAQQLLVVAFAYGIEDAGFNAQLDRELARPASRHLRGPAAAGTRRSAIRRVTWASAYRA